MRFVQIKDDAVAGLRLKMNWQNIVTVRNKLPDVREFAARVRPLFS